MNKILIVDDEKNIQVSLVSVLTDEGYQVFVASSGEEGLEKFRNLQPDLVFLDIWLPGRDGLEILENILKTNPLQVVIMISGHGNISTAVTAVKKGAYDFLEKPLGMDKVIFTVKRALEYRSLLDENKKLKSILNEQREIQEESKAIIKENTGKIAFRSSEIKKFRKQKTVGKSNIFYGIGLHSGEKTGMSVRPLPPDRGIRFENISEEGDVPAFIDYVDQTRHATSIKRDGIEAKTIEHILATLHAAGITNLAIKINKEVPIDDGSASKFCEFVRDCEIVEQEVSIPELIIDRPLIIGQEGDKDRFIKIEPADDFSVFYQALYPEPLGRMSLEFHLTSFADFEREIAPARTYGFVDELNRLAEMRLIEGGRINNFIMIDKGKIINTELRFPDELVRHKILDIIGDFYLLGRPIRGRVTAQKTGHTENTQMVRLIKDEFLRK